MIHTICNTCYKGSYVSPASTRNNSNELQHGHNSTLWDLFSHCTTCVRLPRSSASLVLVSMLNAAPASQRQLPALLHYFFKVILLHPKISSTPIMNNDTWKVHKLFVGKKLLASSSVWTTVSVLLFQLKLSWWIVVRARLGRHQFTSLYFILTFIKRVFILTKSFYFDRKQNLLT